MPVYDTSGPYTDAEVRIDLSRGLPHLRTDWIKQRNDTDILAARSSEYARERERDLMTFHLRFPAPFHSRGARSGGNVSQMHYARKGIVTPEMEFIALPESMNWYQLLEDPVYRSLLSQHRGQPAGEAVRTACILPLSAEGPRNPRALRELRERAPQTPLIVDAGIGLPSHACQVMEGGFDGVLLNTAVSRALDPVRMASAFAKAIKGGRSAFLAGPMILQEAAVSSTPEIGWPFTCSLQDRHIRAARGTVQVWLGRFATAWLSKQNNNQPRAGRQCAEATPSQRFYEVVYTVCFRFPSS